MKVPGSRTISFLASALAFVFFASFAPQSYAVPSFARQTGLACEGCHTVFPELTPFGRAFKLNGYLIDNLPQVKGMTTDNKEALLLNWLPPLSIMFQTSYTSTSKALPDSDPTLSANSQNGQVLFPQQASLFYAGRIAPNIGAFIQMTYASDSGTFGWDNTDIRFADHTSVSGKDLTWGVSLNNNPTVQDVWNSTPAWQSPFDQRSSAAPTPAAATQIDGSLTGNGVAGLTLYGYFANAFYAEFGAYRSSPQGFKNKAGAPGPLDSTAINVVRGAAPYWRLAYEWQQDRSSWSVGTFGMDVELFPGAGAPLSGATNKYRDVAFDTQYQFIGDESIYSVQAVYIHEKQTLDASFASGAAANQSNTLKTLRVGGSYYYQRKYGGGLGYFSTTGSTDPLRYPQGTVADGTAVSGSASGSPDSKGWIAELNYVPWQNVKFALQYTAYNRFNGGGDNYDGLGRNASDNNTIYLLGWFNF